MRQCCTVIDGRRSTAIHEAGHAGISIVERRRFVHVSIVEDDHDLTDLRTTGLDYETKAAVANTVDFKSLTRSAGQLQSVSDRLSEARPTRGDRTPCTAPVLP